jgi:hypothetical protein
VAGNDPRQRFAPPTSLSHDLFPEVAQPAGTREREIVTNPGTDHEVAASPREHEADALGPRGPKGVLDGLLIHADERLVAIRSMLDVIEDPG